MKMKILLRVFTTCIFIVSNTFCSDVFVPQNSTIIHNFVSLYSASLCCMNKNTCNFSTIRLSSNCAPFSIPSKYNTILSTSEYIRMIQSNLLSNELSVWYYIFCCCRSHVIIEKNYWALSNKISYERLPDNCKKLLSENITELRRKCDTKVAQKLSLLTAINVWWKDALSSIKEIVGKQALSHKHTLTEALFILHLKPSSILSVFRQNNEGEDVLFYANCLTGALACVLKHEGKIPSDFEFEILPTDDAKGYFLRNVKKLMQAYTGYLYFISGENTINNRKDKIERSKKKVHNLLQEEEKCKLKQD